ncbi:MAG TPA: HEAT repeat domain-containing protein [Bacteroidota bacterium]|nr:HEAT repeat domain-containing protein [Bacteroidota bacterium]
MNHKAYKALLMLAASGDIEAEDRALLERHLASCEDCRAEYMAQRKLHEEVRGVRPAVEANDALLQEARLELRAALRRERAKAYHFRWREFTLTSPAFRLALGGAFTLLIGAFLGRTFFPASASAERATVDMPVVGASGTHPEEGETRITNIRFIDPGARSGQVEFTFDALTPVRMRGSVDDPQIQKVLTHAILNEENPGVRLRAVNAISAGPTEGQDREVKSALIQALENDRNAGVRREALSALRRMPFDSQIKKALLHTLTSDANPGLRVSAINALDSARTQTSGIDQDILEVLKQKAGTDQNNYIRVKARAVLEEASRR